MNEPPNATLNDRSILRLVQLALSEDVGTGDVTSEALVTEDEQANAKLVAKEAGRMAGSIVAGLVFGEVDRTITCEWAVGEGEDFSSGETLARIQGPLRAILTAERTALNFLQRTCGVATLTRTYVEAVKGTNASILDTRKTIPAWRLLDKYAVRTGGGTNHRTGLYDMVMIKDNHIDAHGSIASAVGAVQQWFEQTGAARVPVEVETRSIEDVIEALACDGVDRVMFDNFDIEQLREAVQIVDNALDTEASGGISLETVRSVAETGVRYISVGALTHSASATDISLLLT
jgi:nicotinate-nucleotide pyrophosphorylase (carboxylating)